MSSKNYWKMPQTNLQMSKQHKVKWTPLARRYRYLWNFQLAVSFTDEQIELLKTEKKAVVDIELKTMHKPGAFEADAQVLIPKEDAES